MNTPTGLRFLSLVLMLGFTGMAPESYTQTTTTPSAATSATAENHLRALDETFRPVSESELDAFYAHPERKVTISIHETQPQFTIARDFLGINMSYFNTTDAIWNHYDFTQKLRMAGVRALRYPGGAETAYFHWQSPGVNGYEDLWDPAARHGTAPGRGRFQSTWVDPAKWATNQDFQNFDEFMAVCQALGAEPLVGLNLSSGRKHNRRADGLNEALAWIRYCHAKNYAVTYWYLDNEPWNHETNYVFQGDEYLEDIVYYATAIKREFPDVKLIINPTSSESYNYWDWLEKIVRRTGSLVDYLDVHWYWGWGNSSFEAWLTTTPLTTRGKWGKPEWERPYGEDIRRIREVCRKAGAPHLGVMALEWNIAPSHDSQMLSPATLAIMQAELLLEFMQADVRMTCLWPLLWQTSRDVWAEQDPFPSIITQEQPYQPTPTLDLFRLVAPLQGETVVAHATENNDVVVLATRASGPATAGHVMVISKNRLRRRVTLTFDGPVAAGRAEMLGVRHANCRSLEVRQPAPNQLSFYAEPYSFSALNTQAP